MRKIRSVVTALPPAVFLLVVGKSDDLTYFHDLLKFFLIFVCCSAFIVMSFSSYSLHCQELWSMSWTWLPCRAESCCLAVHLSAEPAGISSLVSCIPVCMCVVLLSKKPAVLEKGVVFRQPLFFIVCAVQ